MSDTPRYDGLPDPLTGASLASAQRLYREIFVGHQTYFQPFREVAQSRAILPRTHGYQLSQRQFEALAASALLLHEDAAYICKVEGHEGATDHPDCWVLKLSDYATYRTMFLPLMEESLFLSVTGKWAIFISQEWFAVAAGPTIFTRTLTRLLNIGTQEIVGFIVNNADGCRDISRLPWLKELITHVYGQDQGWQLLKGAGFVKSGEPVPSENSTREAEQDVDG